MNTFTDAVPTSAPDPLQQVLDETRQRFVVSFLGQCDAIRLLVDKVAAAGASGPVATLAQVIHRLSGLAGTIGFPTISARASELEHFVVDRPESGAAFDGASARQRVDAIEAAFAVDLAAAVLRPVPAIGSAATMPADAVPADIAPVGGAKVLIVEDDPDQRAALGAIRAHTPDVLVLDLMMPKVSGFDVLETLQQGGGPSPRIMVLSGRGREQDVLRAFALGAEDYMTKPFTPHEMMTRVARLRPHPAAAA